MGPLLLFPLLVSLARPPQTDGFVARPDEPAPVWVERRLAAMGTWLELRVAAPERAAALAASEAALRALEAVEDRLSTWREDSELARLNRAPLGEAQTLSVALAEDLARARGYHALTGGAFDPALGALVAAWGLRTGGRQPAAAELAAARAAGGPAGFELTGRSARRLLPLAAFEEGGFGKGIGLDAALAALRAADVRAAVIDLGGQLAALGAPHGTTLADPRARERAVLALELGPGSFSTSGNSERGILVEGVARGHLLDPRSGEPAPDFGSLSVWAADATAADCLSTGLYVLGPEAALRFAGAHPGIELVLLLPRGERLAAVATEAWRGRLRPLVSDLELVFVDVRSLPPSGPVPALAFR